MRPIPSALVASLALLALAAAADERPKNIRICIQFIEVPHAVLTELLANPETAGPALHDKVLALANDGTVQLLETCVVTGRHGQRATVESVRETIYPTEYLPPGMWPPAPTPVPGQAPHPEPPKQRLVRPHLGDAWETRNVGTTLEIEPNITDDGRMIDLRFTPEIIQLLRMDTFMEYVDQWGDASIRMPIFQTCRTNTSMTLLAGQFAMVGAITPRPNTAGPALTRKLLVFARADIVPVPTDP